ncbi:MAG TPA: hypothetical protein VGK10_12845 [Prolixibacteraceae bacterium]|jgi:hypothetical protein
MKLKNVIQLALLATVIMFTTPSCVKEGPMGLQGEKGADGTNGVDANETCKVCHSATSVDKIATQFEFSKHSYGEAAFEESGNTGCTPCHAQEAFKYVTKNNVPSTFTLNTTTNKWVNNYATIATAAYGEIGCSTCHSSLHTTYGAADIALTTVAPVDMTMWGATKTIDLPADDHKSNLCVKCHQPRPFTNALTGNVLDYVALATTAGVVYDGNPTGATNIIKPSYRTHTHYGTAGAVYAGKGGVEFPGTLAYTNSQHTTVASCIDCHMGPQAGKSDVVGRAGGHTFVAKGNLTTCNATGCHSAAVTSTTTNLWVNPRKEIKDLLNALAAKLNEGGVEILNRNPDAESNMWAGLTTNNYDGYLNVYDPITNPTGQVNNPSSFKFVGNPPATWNQAQKDYNATLPTLTLSNAQMGALINFQLCLRDYSLGIHNFNYTKALLTNSIAKLN